MRSSWPIAAALAGCYQPHASPGAPCSAGGGCPTGLMCVADVCVLDGTQPIDAPRLVDGAIDSPVLIDAAADARSDASPDAPAPDAPVDAAPIPIAWRGTTTAFVDAATPATSITVAKPACPIGAVMVGAVAMGKTGSATMPAFTAPSGWTLVRRLDHGPDTGLGIYWHAAGVLEPASYTWQLSALIEGVAWISCYTGVDTVTPIGADLGVVDASLGPPYATPKITTTRANSMLVATFMSHESSPMLTTWTSPTTLRANLNNNNSRSGAGIELLFAPVGMTGTLAATASVAQDYALIDLLALNPGP